MLGAFRLLCATAAALLLGALALPAPSWADGVPYRSRVAQADNAAAPFSWTGLYIGGGLGLSLTGRDGANNVEAEKDSYGYIKNFNLLDPAFFDRNVAADVRVGFDLQLPNTPLVVGVLAGYELDLGGKLTDGTPYVGGRAGIAFASKTLAYGGATWLPDAGNNVRWMGGLEQAVLPAATIGVEYGYTDFDGGFDVHDVKVRFNVRPAAGLF